MALARDPDLTKQIYAENIDTRNRLPYVGRGVQSTPSNFAVEFTDPLKRVTVVQLGDFAMGCDPRYTIEDSRRLFQILEPIIVPTQTSLVITEATVQFTPSSITTLSSTSAYSLEYPPTYNRISSATDSSPYEFLYTQTPHCLNSVWALFPNGTNNEVAIRASKYFNVDPLVTSVTASLSADPYELGILSTYLSSSCTKAAGSTVTAFVGSYVHTPALTVPEWCQVINNTWASQTAMGNLKASYNLRFNSITGEINFWVSNGINAIAPGTYTEVFASLTVRQYDALWWLGLDSVGYPIRLLENQTLNRETVYEDLTPYVYRFYPRVSRTVEMPRGNPDLPELLAELNHRTNGMYLSPTLSTLSRTLNYEGPDSILRTLSITPGGWRADLFSRWLTSNLSISNTFSGYSCTIAAEEGRYRIFNWASQSFNLDYRSTTDLARAMGYKPVEYSGDYKYLADQDSRPTTMYWNFDLGDNTISMLSMQKNYYKWTGSSITRMLRLAIDNVNEASQTIIASRSSALNSATWSTYAWSDATAPLVSGYQPFDLVRITSGGTISFSVIVSSLSSLTSGSGNNVIFDFGAISISGGGPDIGVSDWFSTKKANRPAFVLSGIRPRVTSFFNITDPIAYTVQNRTEPFLIGGAAYGPIAEVLGISGYATLSLNGIQYMVDQYCLNPPDYMFLEMVEPVGHSTRNATRQVIHGPYDAASDYRAIKHILAKLIVTNGFAKISEEVVHNTLDKPTQISRIRFRLVNPDFSLVDFHGRDVSFTLLMRVSEGSATGIGVA